MNTMLGHGVYNFAEAAGLTRLRPQTVREWFTARPPARGRERALESDYDSVGGDRAISFLELIELFIAGQLRERGVSLQTLRKVRRQLKTDLETPHPFCRFELLSDGEDLFTSGLDDDGRKEMVEVLRGKRAFVDILLPFLKTIDYDAVTKLASKWNVADKIVIDPTRCLGKPIVEDVCMRTSILASAYRANDLDSALVAEWYGVLPAHVMAADQFERSLLS